MSEYFPKPEFLGANMKVQLYLSNYATQAHFKNGTGNVDTSKFAKMIDLASLKSEVNKLDLEELGKKLLTGLNSF